MANLPPTPGPSAEIASITRTLSASIDAVRLPPPAIASSRASTSPSSVDDANSDSSYRPISPASPEARLNVPDKPPSSSAARKRSSVVAGIDDGRGNADNYALPPPPTRSRKIIQMKPQSNATRRAKEQGQSSQAGQAAHSPTKHTAAATASGSASAPAGGKKKQAGASTAAGRKSARKTAHSLIERRRRSKMNEEFGVLKDMIPACAGQDMHKLAILQASIEYMRYLETCVTELKAARKSSEPSHSSNRIDAFTTLPPLSDISTPNPDEVETAEMSPHPPKSRPGDRRHTKSKSIQSHPSLSPAIFSSANNSPMLSRPGTSTAQGQSFSTLPSPAVLAQHQYAPSLPDLNLTSPEIQAQHHSNASHLQLSPIVGANEGHTNDAKEHEATASALLMLNTDRRSWVPSGSSSSSGRRGMSVKDFLA